MSLTGKRLFKWTSVYFLVVMLLLVFTSFASAAPRQKYYADTDGDTYGDPENWVRDTSPPPGYVEDDTDCDDTDPNVNPGESEVCGDGIDNNCDGQVDEGCGGGQQTYYRDADGDTYGDPNDSVQDTSPPAGYVSDNTDCDDTDPAINPGATEICGNAIDEDCDGSDDACGAGHGKSFYYADTDSDTYGDPNDVVESKNPPSGYVANNVDCDDTNPNVNPFALEVCDGVDNNCDGQTDEGCVTYYEDADSDTYGNAAVSQEATSQPAGYVLDSTDCDDTDPNVNPGAAEIPDDGIDNDCDGLLADTYYADADGDTYGDPNVTQVATSQPAGYVSDSTDCDDTDPNIHPGALEIPNDGIDNDCNGQIDENLALNVPSEVPTIQGAIDIAVSGTEIIVADGTYVENIDFLGKDLDIHSENGPYSTTIDGGQNGSVVSFLSGETQASSLYGFTITNGSGQDITGYGYMVGNGIAINDSSSPFIGNCVITGNSGNGGEAVYVGITSSPWFYYCYVSGNLSDGMQIEATGDVMIESCLFENNFGRGLIVNGAPFMSIQVADSYIVDNQGGGVLIKDDSFTTFIRTTISRNFSMTPGAGVSIEATYPDAFLDSMFINCMITDNHSADVGGGVNMSYLTETPFMPSFVNCTIANNMSDMSGGGIMSTEYNLNSSMIVNTIVWGNTAPIYPDISDPFFFTDVTYSDIGSGGHPGIGNISADPLFVDGDNPVPFLRDYHLSPLSPCIDTGTDIGAPFDDIDHEPRPYGPGVDIGADEVNPFP